MVVVGRESMLEVAAAVATMATPGKRDRASQEQLSRFKIQSGTWRERHLPDHTHYGTLESTAGTSSRVRKLRKDARSATTIQRNDEAALRRRITITTSRKSLLLVIFDPKLFKETSK